MTDDRDAWAAHVMRVRATLRPEDHQPWKQSRPGGWKLAEAMVTLVPPSERNSVSNLLARVHAGIEPAEDQALWALHYWRLLLSRLQLGELRVRGRQLSEAAVQDIPSDMLDDAKPNFGENRITCCGMIFASVRVLEVEQAAALVPLPAPIPESTGAPRRGGLDYATADAPLIRRMASMIAAGEARGPMDAARAVVGDASGGGTDESKIKRLITRFAQLRSSGQD